MTTTVRVRDVLVEQLVTLPLGSATLQRELAEMLKKLGGRILQSYSARVHVVELPSAEKASFDERLSKAMPSLGAASAAPALALPEALGASAFRVRASDEYANAKAARPHAAASWGQAPPDGPPDTVHSESLPGEGGQMGAPPVDMSPFLIGSVAVGLVMVEGPIADLQFSNAERSKVAAEVQDGLSWLAQQEPAANISWSYDIRVLRLDVPADPSLPNTFEDLEAHWRDPAMAQLGVSASFQGVVEYASSLQTLLGTDHAYVALFTKYPLHHFAYARKPVVVMHYENDGWGPDNIAEVFTHETGHIFGCPDEYQESGCRCTTRHGVLREVNGNCENCANPPVPCLMARNVRDLCAFTRVHFGWRDSNNDGVFDPLD